MVLTACLVAWAGTPRALVLITGGAYVAVGLADAALTRGRHVGWPMLAGAGLVTLLGAA